MDSDTLHAALRLTLRLTREHEFAVMFAEQGGPRLLLSLTQAHSFQGFLSLITLILRHVLEETSAIQHCMEKVNQAQKCSITRSEKLNQMLWPGRTGLIILLPVHPHF